MWYPPKERTEQLDAQLADLETKPADCDNNVEDFLVQTSASIHQLSVNALVPPAYLRDWVWIGSQFRINSGIDNRVHSLTRRALLFLYESLDLGSHVDPKFRQDINWVSDSTISDLTGELGQNAYNSFLSRDELREVESRLQDLRNEAADFSADEENSLQGYLSYFRDVSSETYLPGIADMIARIHEKLASSGEDRRAALACLRYVVEEKDVVNDSLGYLGLVDDVYAVEHTYREIGNRSTWGPLLGRFNSKWPYVTRVAFEEASRTIRLSSFMQAVFGNALHGLSKEGNRSCLVLPETGICGLIGAFLACIEPIRAQAASETEHRELVTGDDILFGDSKVMIRARYAGVLEYDGDTFHSIEVRGGRRTVSESILSLAHRAARPHKHLSKEGEFIEWRESYSPTPLTHLVGCDFRFGDLRPEVLLVTRRNRLDELLPEIKPMGKTIPELVGVKYITSTGIEGSLPGSLIGDPLIWSCSDANTARELIMSADSGFNPRYVIIDEAGLAGELEDVLLPGEVPKHSSHISISPLHEMEVIRRLQDRDFDTWILQQSDVELVPDPSLKALRDNSGTVSRYQKRQEIKAHVTSEICDIQCEPIEILYEKLRGLRRTFRDSDDTQQDVVAMAASAFVRRFIRSPLEFDEIETEELRILLVNLRAHCGTLADYYPEIRDLSELVQSILEEGVPDNPRQAAIEKLIEKNGFVSISVLCPSARVADLATRRTADHTVLDKARWLSLNQLRQEAPFGQIIVPGWIDRHAMRELRNTGYATHIDLVLYEFEREWETRSRKASRSWEKRLASKMSTQWGSLKETFDDLAEPTFPEEEPIDVDNDEIGEPVEPETDILEAQFIDTIRRHASVGQPGAPVAMARLVAFEEIGAYIFLPPYGSVISLSRALDAVADLPQDDEDEEGDGEDNAGRRAERLISCPVREITPGDLLAFPVDSTSDLLGSLAKRFIPEPEETRRLADLWRTALKEYLESTEKSIQTLRNELKAGGLKRHPFTVKVWVDGMDIVAPLKYADAITVIAEVTGHKELESRADDVRSAIDLVYRARGKAAGEILKQLARRDIELSEGSASVRIEGHEIQYRLHRVLSIDQPTDVPQDEIGILKNITDFSQ